VTITDKVSTLNKEAITAGGGMAYFWHGRQIFARPFRIGPGEQKDVYNRYCQSGRRAVIDQTPFPRMVDLCFARMSLATRKELLPVEPSKQKTSKFNDGSIVDRDSWRVQAMMLVAIAGEDNLEIVANPRRKMMIANGLAAVGIPHVSEMLRDGDQDPIWNLSEALDGFLPKQRAT
jgi:hypothetical protein